MVSRSIGTVGLVVSSINFGLWSTLTFYGSFVHCYIPQQGFYKTFQLPHVSQYSNDLHIRLCKRKSWLSGDVSCRIGSTLLKSGKSDGDNDDDEDDDGDEEISLGDGDWRAFRAKLVMGEASGGSKTKEQKALEADDDFDGIGLLYDDASAAVTEQGGSESTSSALKSTQGLTPLDPSQWAYESGDVIEKGAVILGGVEQEFGFGLRQQYFHKAAILVLDHTATFTKGIILNRPSDLLLEDDTNEDTSWKVWFGGDVQGLDSSNPDVVCLHSLKNDLAAKASVPIMNDMQWTTFDNAKKLVKAGVANVQDFWVFAGYAGWGPGQLMEELDRNSWYMVATDSQTLLKELARQGDGADPRDAGLDTWTLLMSMIGREQTAQDFSRDFDDFMLKEWAMKHLLSTAAGGGAGRQQRSPDGSSNDENDLLGGSSLTSLDRSSSLEGALIRASSEERSPFLLDNQELHKSIILVLSDDQNISIGAILNRPAAKGLDIKIKHEEASGSRQVTIPLRYGGQYAVRGSESLLWLHCSSSLRDAKVGSPVSVEKRNGVWKCTADDVTLAISQGKATPQDFIVVSGLMVWTNGAKSSSKGLEGEILSGKFEIIPNKSFRKVWDALVSQEVLSSSNIAKNLALADEAWTRAMNDEISNGSKGNDSKTYEVPIAGLGEGFDEEDDSVVFKTDMKVSKLSDDAMRSWVATFLLGAPSLEI